MRNDKEDTPNAIDTETIKKVLTSLAPNFIITFIKKQIDNRQHKVIEDTSKFTTAGHVSIIIFAVNDVSKENNFLTKQ